MSPVKRRSFSTELKLISSSGFMDMIEISVPHKESSTLIINRFSVRSKKNKKFAIKGNIQDHFLRERCVYFLHGILFHESFV